MIPELGHFALILALVMAVIQSVFPLVGAHTGNLTWMNLAVPAARAQLLFMAVSFACLTAAFITNDFSVAYVAHNGNTETPLIYKISGVWGAHEGSLLLWALTMSAWTGAVTLYSGRLPRDMSARVLGVLGLIAIGFIMFMLFTSNPFDRLVPAPAEGRDLNPLLQDPGLAIHPPLLYMGYVGFAVPFAFAIAAMLGGRLDAAWARWSRPWTAVAWLSLTAGITLGSWWAYYELGWGGWWFWDPVENASFMPWLVGTALMHSLAVTEKRGAFKAWTVLLAIFAFSLSLLGTFLVRSGVLTSVHSFAADPERGLFILIFLLAVVGAALALYTFRAAEVKSDVRFEILSREFGLLVNNLLLVVIAGMVLLGTLAPLLVDALNFLFPSLQIGKLSVGFPWFNFMFVVFAVPLGLAVGFGVTARWKNDSAGRMLQVLRWPAIIALVLAVALPALFAPEYMWKASLGLLVAFWIAGVTVQSVRDRLSNGRKLASVPRGFWGMTLGHIGIAVFAVGVTLTSLYSTEKDIRLAPGESYDLAGYHFYFYGVEGRDGPNYHADRGHVTVTYEGEEIADLWPEKRVYRAQPMPMTEAAIDAGLTRDLFVALGEPLGEDGAWALRVYHKPFVRWIWLGGLLMTIGGLVSATDRRYRLQARREASLDKRVAGAAS
jgi:cytochrome c-type biogenesis protein CcmF